jgi:hypothetical protein
LAKVDPENASWQRDLLLSYSKVGDVLMAQGNVAKALKSYRDGLAVADRLAESKAHDGDPPAIDTPRQPLTRVDCDKAGVVAWNDSANVCGSVVGEATAQMAPRSAPETASQPLTRADCNKAGMKWSDRANVCGTKSEESKTQAASGAPPEPLTEGTASQSLTDTN